MNRFCQYPKLPCRLLSSTRIGFFQRDCIISSQLRDSAGFTPGFRRFSQRFFCWNRFLHSYEVITTLVCLQKKLWSLSAAEQIAAPEGINMIGWLHDRPLVMYPAIVASIVYCTLYRCGIYPQLDRRFKSWATPENLWVAGYMGDQQTGCITP